MLSRRQKDILQQLERADDFISIRTLCETCSLSEKTMLSELTVIEAILQEQEIGVLIRKRGSGVSLQLLFDVILQTNFPHILQELFTALFILYVQQNVKDIIIESKIHTAVEMMMQLGGSKVIRNFLYLIASVKGVRQKQLTQQSHMQTKTLCLPLMQQRSIGSIYIHGLDRKSDV